MDVEYGGRDNKLTPINSINIVFFLNSIVEVLNFDTIHYEFKIQNIKL